MENYDLIVIGGGPAGFFAALTTVEKNPNLRVLILEKGRKLLAKVLISGGGRCNVTHACYDPAELTTYYPRGNKELRGPFTRFQPKDTVAWFENQGIQLKTEADGRIFPTTDRSKTIVDCILDTAKKLGIQIQTNQKVTSISPSAGGFDVTLNNSKILSSKNILLATGGGSQSAYDIASNLGHTIVPPVPSLFTFNIRDPRIKGLEGISLPMVKLTIANLEKNSSKKVAQIKSSGPLLITHWGLSGPAALKLSAWGARVFAEAQYQIPLTINWIPPHTPGSALALLKEIKTNNPRQQAAKHPLQGTVPSRLWQRLVSAAGIGPVQPWNEISNQGLQKLAQELVVGLYKIHGKGVFKEEFVTCGGVDLKEINFKTMESRIQPGLYFAGEVLDIDGLTGGFNFQSAWTTGWLAGQAIAGA